jgi:exodeoxyribonuclease V alpha subunit
VHRFADPEYAELSLAMRTGVRAGEVFDALVKRGQVRLYPSEAERTQALADLAAESRLTGERGVLVMVDTRDQVTALNGAIRDRLVAAAYVDNRHGVVTGAGEHLGVGDRVMTRRNDRDLAVANRDTWTITAIDPNGTTTVQGDGRTGSRSLPAGYLHDHVELAYATTVHGAQGETTHTGHLLLGEHTTAAAAYVAMTRGRTDNVAHLVAEDLDDARQLWAETFGRDRADLGPTHAAMRAAQDLERYAPHRPLEPALADLRAAWTDEQDLRDALARYQNRHALMAEIGEPDPTWVAELTAQIDELRDQLSIATDRVRASLLEPAIRSLPRGRVEQENAGWLQDRREQQLVQSGWEERRSPGPSRGRPSYGHPNTPDRGRGVSR